MVQTVNIVAQRDLTPGSMITRNLGIVFLNFIGNIHHLVMFTSESCCPLLVRHPGNCCVIIAPLKGHSSRCYPYLKT